MTWPSTSSGKSWPAEAQHCTPVVSQPHTFARNTRAWQFFLDPVFKVIQDHQDLRHLQDTLDPYEQSEQIQPTLEAPLDEEEYQALLDDL